MQIANRDTSRRFGESAHRPGGIGFVSLLRGTEGSADNFELVIARANSAYNTPKHRHNFDQVRIMLSGEFGFGDDGVQREGSVGYFCEGTYYEQHGIGDSETLLLQAGGASGNGFVSFERLYSTVDSLKARGEFHDGIFTWLDAAGQRHNQDGYEAVWEEVNRQKLIYPEPRYQSPVLMNPEAFKWLQVPGQPAIAARELGVFHERGLALGQVQLQSRAEFAIAACDSARLLFVFDGEGLIGDQPLRKHSAVKLEAGESVLITSGTRMHLQTIRLPRFMDV